MNIYRIIASASAALLILSCQKQEMEEGSHVETLKVTLASANPSQESHIPAAEWKESDKIAVMIRNSSSYGQIRDVRLMSYDQKEGLFNVNIPDGYTASHVVFPSSGQIKWEDGGIKLRVEESAYAVSENLDPKINVSIGTVREDGTVLLNNVMALFKVYVNSDDITSISYSGNNGESVAGYPVFDAQTYEVLSITDGRQSVTIKGGSTLKQGCYYMPVIPVNFSKGITLTITDKAGNTNVRKSEESFTPKGNTVYDLSSDHLDLSDSTLQDATDDSFKEDESDERIIPDFSRVGYRYGDREIPDYPVGATLYPSADGKDRSAEINSALNALPEGSALLLKEGTYHLGAPVRISRSGIVLRGEGAEKTILHSTMKAADGSSIIMMESQNDGYRHFDMNCWSGISDEHTPAGRMYVNVEDATGFNVGDRVIIHRSATSRWIHDIKMDQIPAIEGYTIRSLWTSDEIDTNWERVITQIDGRRIWLDNPLVMDIDKEYGGGELIKCYSNRISESGVEHLSIEADHDRDLYPVSTDEDYKYYNNGVIYSCDEDHPSNCIKIRRAEHCWVRNIIGRHYIFNMVGIATGARQITVRDCTAEEPVGHIQGSRRYAFHIGQGETSLFINCTTDSDRHNFVTSGNTPGPHVFLRCTSNNSFSVTGPHNKWASGVLYDNVTCVSAYNGDYVNSRGLNICSLLGVEDADNTGKESHGWQGVSFVFWNCDATHLICQSPWVTGTNWCVGCTGRKHWSSDKDLNNEPTEANLSGGRNGNSSLPCARPDGEWASHGTKVTSGNWYGWNIDGDSLYESQLRARHNSGIYITQ